MEQKPPSKMTLKQRWPIMDEAARRLEINTRGVQAVLKDLQDA